MPKRIAVVGGGISGLCTAVALVKRGVKPIVLERKRIGGSQGSSHGPSRITRSVYADAAYVRIMQRLHREHWPALEKMLGEPLLFKTDGLFFGHAGLWEKYLAAVLSQQIEVERLDVSEARRRFTQFKLATATSALHDRTAAVIAAERVIRGLHGWLGEHGVETRQDTRLLRVEPRPDSVSLVLEGERLDVDAVVLCMGSWIGELVPELQEKLTVLRQTIGYYDFGDGKRSRPPQFPVWVSVGNDEDEVHYGLPEFDKPGVKVARHRTIGTNENPEGESDPHAELEDIDEFIAKEFQGKPVERLSYEQCLYTVAPSENFVLGLHPDDSRIVIGSACSGHGFKFGPWTGEVLADFAMSGECLDHDYVRERDRFSPTRLWNSKPEVSP